MLRYRTRITTSRDREETFSDLSHFDLAAEWDPGVDEAKMLTPEPVGRGSRFALQTRFLGRSVPLEYEIVEFEPGTRVVLRAENPFVRSIDAISFESVTNGALPDATVVTYDAQLEPKGVARLAERLLALAFRRIGDRAAAGLHRYLASVRPT